MSALLKAGDIRALSLVRDFAHKPENSRLPIPTPAHAQDGREEGAPFSPASQSTTIFAPAPGRLDELDQQCMEFEASIADLRHQLAEAEHDARFREDAAYSKGRKDGVELSADEEEKRAAAFAAMLEKLQHTHSDKLAQYELLALQLARTALDRIFGNEQLHTELITAAVQNQLGRIRRELVTRIRLAPQHLASKAAGQNIAQHFAGIEVAPDSSLETDECEIDLHLGKIDLSLPGQWQRLGEFFDQLAEEERPA